MHSTRISPPNSLLFISDPAVGMVPEFVAGKLILSTTSCVSVNCYPEQDGPTEVILGRAEEVNPATAPAFDGGLETPSRAVVVLTVERETVLRKQVPTTHTRLRIWVDHPRWPQRVIIGVGY